MKHKCAYHGCNAESEQPRLDGWAVAWDRGIKDSLYCPVHAKLKRELYRDGIIAFAVYFGVALLLYLVFSHACAGCTDWWDITAMFAYTGWGIGGLPAGWYVAGWIQRQYQRDDDDGFRRV